MEVLGLMLFFDFLKDEFLHIGPVIANQKLAKLLLDFI